MGSYPIYKSKPSFFLMLIKNYHVLFLTLLFSGTFIAISANSWFTSWIGLEINLMSIIPLILIKLNSIFTESAIKYFLAQAIASIIIIFSTSLRFSIFKTNRIEILEILLFFALILKAGIAPLHFWFPQVIFHLRWWQSFLIFTWQKIAPLILITSINFNLIVITRIISTITGALGGLNQTSIKIIITYSSISHRGWILLACYLNFKSWIIYFSIYIFLTASIITFLYFNNVEKINQVFLNNDSYTNKIITSINLFSLGGLPPLLGFSAKLLIIITAIKNNLNILFLILILSSVLSLFFYTRITYSNLMSINKAFKKQPNITKSTFKLFTLRIFLNAIAPIIFILI